MDEIVPAGIRLQAPLELPEAESEFAYHRRLRALAGRNRVARSYIGMGYHDTITPAVIQRNVFENPGWYTPYTPYQAEIAQGRLESLLNFQTMVADLTAMPVANASLLDEATAAAEAMGVTSSRLEELGIVDQTIAEPLGGAHRDMKGMADRLKEQLVEQVARFQAMDVNAMLERRYQRLMSHGAQQAR